MIEPNIYCSNTDRAFSSIEVGDYIKVFREKRWLIGVVTKLCPIQKHVRWIHNNKSGYVLPNHFQFLSESEIDDVTSSRPTRDPTFDEAMQDLCSMATRMLHIHAREHDLSFEESSQIFHSSIQHEHTRQTRDDSATKREK